MASASAPASWPAWVPVLTSYGDEQQYGSVSQINPFLPNLFLGHDVCAGIETLTKTLSISDFVNFAIFDGKSKHECLSQGFYSCTNIMTKKQVGEERVYSAYTSILLLLTKGCQDWNSSRSESRIWCRGHGGMFFTGLLSYRTQDYQPRDGPTHKGPFPLITNWENALQWISWRHFLNWSSFLCDNSSCVKLT